MDVIRNKTENLPKLLVFTGLKSLFLRGVLRVLLFCCTLLCHLLAEVYSHRGATNGPQYRRTPWVPPPCPTGCPLSLVASRGRQLRVRRRRRRSRREVDTGGDWGRLAALSLPTNLLGEEGQVVPQLGHAALELVALAQQLLLLTHLDRKTNSLFVHILVLIKMQQNF